MFVMTTVGWLSQPGKAVAVLSRDASKGGRVDRRSGGLGIPTLKHRFEIARGNIASLGRVALLHYVTVSSAR